MQRRFWLSGLMLAIGVSLLMAAGLASPASSSPQASAKNGGTLRIVRRSPFDHIDPSRAYFSHTWAMEFATACKLFNFGETNSVPKPEAATGFPKVSNSGKTYTFTVKTGKQAMRFADGKTVTAANFAWALNRALLWQPYSPASDFLNDTSGTQIVGAQDLIDKKAQKASGIQVKGNKLIVKLTKPSPVFVTQLTMPFFQAMPLNWPITELRESDLGGATSPGNTCGPYTLTSSTRTSFAVLTRNKFYRGSRPHHLTEVRWTMGVNPDSQQLQVEKNQQDIGGFPPAATAQLQQKYGPSGRFVKKAQSVVWYVAMNTTQKAFAGNPQLRRAVNFAINRNGLTQLDGAGAATATDQMLPPQGMPGFKDWKIYPFAPNLAKAKKAASGHLRDKSLTFYTFQDDPGPSWAQLVQSNLKAIGLNADVKVYERTVQAEKTQHRGEPFDMTIEGWGSDYPDPYDFLNILMAGKNIHETANLNIAYWNDPKWNKKLDQAAALPIGPKRYTAYANLDRDIAKGPAPYAPFLNNNALALLSNRMKHFVWNPVYGTDYAGIDLK